MTVAAGQRVTEIPVPGDWSRLGACTNPEVDREIFFTEGQADTAIAYKAFIVCSSCEVRDDCLAYSCGSAFIDGTWGAVTVSIRRKKKRDYALLRKISIENMKKAFRFYDRRENREKLSGIYLQLFHENRGRYLND